MAGHFNPKDYIDVQTRINRFWEEYPAGAIRTELASSPDDFSTCRYLAEVYKDAASVSPDAVGYAFEIAGSGMANKTSHEENCETSAIGRALANMGYATSLKDRPSQQEMSKVASGKTNAPRANQAPATDMEGPITEAAMKRLHAILAENDLGHEHLHAYAVDQGHESSKQLTMMQAKKLADGLKSKPGVAVKYLQGLADKAELEQVGLEVGAKADAQKAGK